MALQGTRFVLYLLFVSLIGIVNGEGGGGGGATETQTAQCTITSGDVKASAQASVTTRLDGVCETSSMMTAFHLLESRLLLEIYNIRLVLSQLQNPAYSLLQHNQLLFPHVNLSPTLFHKIAPPPPKEKESASPNTNAVQVVPAQSQTNNSIAAAGPISDSTGTTPDPLVLNATPSPASTSTTTERITPRQSLFPFLKSLPSSRKIAPGSRDSEVYKFNNTILSGNEVQVFTYFWKIENYTRLDKNATDLYSPAFVIAGFNLRIKASLNHLNRDFLYLRLEEIPKNQTLGLTSVILETGDDLFHEIGVSNTFRYKITVLDQSPKKNDLISQEFSDTTSGFMIPASALTSTDTYTKDNLILVKVILYL